MALGAFALFLVPAAPFSWIGLTLIAVYVMRGAAPASIHRRGAAILLAVTVPMFWSRLAFSLFGDALLRIDAALVSATTGAYRVGNAIAFADSWGYYWIAPACSSVANISLAFLVYILTREIPSGERRLPFRYGLLAMFSVVALNIARMGITGISRAHYDLMHGSLGTALAGWLSLAAMTGICWWGFTGCAMRKSALSNYACSPGLRCPWASRSHPAGPAEIRWPGTCKQRPPSRIGGSASKASFPIAIRRCCRFTNRAATCRSRKFPARLAP
jgi:hypothetical protein